MDNQKLPFEIEAGGTLISKVLQELCEEKLQRDYLRYKATSTDCGAEGRTFEDYRRSAMGAIGKGFNPSSNSSGFKAANLLTRLVPDWKRRKEMISLRMKTLLKIYLTKWFYIGLEWYEIDLVLQLLDYNLGLDSDFVTPQSLGKLGITLFLNLLEEDSKLSFNNKGWKLLEVGNLEEFIYPEDTFHQVWNLRSVQSLRDFIFQPVNLSEHEGKRGIRKPRIRGYRDGKSSPKDPTLTAMARQVDVAFFSRIHEERLESFWQDVEALCKT